MPKKSKPLGKDTLKASIIQGISQKGIWILVNDQEFFLSFAEFPWFLKSTVEQIYNLELIHGKHLHWPEIDVDVEIDSLKAPGAYPLQYS